MVAYQVGMSYLLPFRPTLTSLRSSTSGHDSDSDWTDDEGETGEENAGDFTGAEDVLRQCTKNWKSAARDKKKKMWGVFDETGIFAAACRHGFILWIIDIVKSSKL